LGACFSNRLEFADGALKNRNLRYRIAGGFEFRADLIFEVGGVSHAVFGLTEGAETVSPIGNRDKGSSPYGVHDLAGNLYEWVTDWYDEEFYTRPPTRNPRGPGEGTAKVQRGGSYNNGPYRLRSAFRTKGDPTEHDPHVGFRCARDAPALP
jgi:hypothetical protein